MCCSVFIVQVVWNCDVLSLSLASASSSLIGCLVFSLFVMRK